MTPLQWWMAAIMAFAMVLALSWCAKAQAQGCESTAASVLAKGAKHATWRLIAGHRCWRAGYPAAARIGSSVLPRPKPRIRPLVPIGRISAPPPWHMYTQKDVDAAWKRYDDARRNYDSAAMFLNLLLFGTLCPQSNGECSFDRRPGR